MTSDEEKEDGESGEESDENAVVAGTKLPKKYAFLALSREDMTPAQRRWKWVKFEALPDDMKPLIRPPKSIKETKVKTDKAVKVIKEVTETNVDVENDKDLDYTKLDNVEMTLNKFKNQQTSRKNFDIEMHILVFNLML